MAYLKDLSVKKISFVHRPANNRKFILLKSGDEGSDNNNNNNEGDIFTMRKELKTRLTEIMKSETSPDKIVEMLKADTTLKVADAEITEITDFLEVMPVEKKKADDPPPVVPPIKKADDNNNNNNKDDEEKKALLKANQDLMTRLSVIEKDQKKRDVISWLQKECKFMPEGVDTTADIIMQLEESSKEAAEKYKDTLKKASAAIENSKLFTENGVTTDTLLKEESNGFELVSKVSRAFDEVRKNDTKPMSSNTIKNIVNSFGGAAYENYRQSHILRAKTN